MLIKRMEEGIRLVEVQNFVRTRKVVNIEKYVKTCKRFFEYLMMIVLLEVGKESPLLFWRVWLSRNKSIDEVNRLFQVICRSRKCNDLIPLLRQYYFEDSKVIQKNIETEKYIYDTKKIVLTGIIRKCCDIFSY